MGDVSYSVGTKGQVVIPKEIRDALQIRPGQEMHFERRGDDILLRKSSTIPLLGRFAGEDLIGALERERALDREREDERGPRRP
jgi:AbrB family looped-hinge helix DNA binding protein